MPSYLYDWIVPRFLYSFVCINATTPYQAIIPFLVLIQVFGWVALHSLQPSCTLLPFMVVLFRSLYKKWPFLWSLSFCLLQLVGEYSIHSKECSHQLIPYILDSTLTIITILFIFQNMSCRQKLNEQFNINYVSDLDRESYNHRANELFERRYICQHRGKLLNLNYEYYSHWFTVNPFGVSGICSS